MRPVAALAALAGLLFVAALCRAQSSGPTGKIATRTELSVATLEGATRTQATFTAKVRPANSQDGQPTGSVSFFTGSNSIGAALLDGEGKATYSVAALPQGIQKITAVYQGDDANGGSTSAAAPVSSVTSGVPGFTLTASQTSLSAVAGAAATTVITVTPENGFSQAVALSCSGLPYASTTCTYIPASATPGAPTGAAPNGTPATSTLIIQTQAPSAALEPAPGKAEDRPLYAFLLPGALALAGLAAARKRWFTSLRMMGLAALLLAGGLGLSSCAARYGYFHKPPAGNPGTPLGNYTVVVSGITGTGSTLTTGNLSLALAVTK